MNPDQTSHDIDWLRVFATYLLFVFHVGMVFNPAPFYHVRNADLSFALLVVCGFISLWHMPLFFLLAGWSACRRFGARDSGSSYGAPLRLGIPLVAGCVLLMPVIKYFELRSGLDLRTTPGSASRRAPGRLPPRHPGRAAGRSAVPRELPRPSSRRSSRSSTASRGRTSGSSRTSSRSPFSTCRCSGGSRRASMLRGWRPRSGSMRRSSRSPWCR